MNFEVIKTKIPGVIIIQPKCFIDDRGYFLESYNKTSYKEILPNINFVQDNESQSSYGVLRGLHFQKEPFAQAKLVRVIKGEIQDVAIDIRPNSKTYKKYVSVVLNDENRKQLFIPKGFAHGFVVKSNKAIVSYKVNNYFNPEYDSGIKYNDTSINIKWSIPENEIILSKKDSKLSPLK